MAAGIKSPYHPSLLINYFKILKSSSKKLKTQKSINLDNDAATSKISLAYESLRELLEALSINKGYKIYNHECYYAFLNEILGESEMADTFNKLRMIRNDVNYYGKDISAEEAEPILNELENLIKNIKRKLGE